MGFRSNVANLDVWIRPGIKNDGEDYYEYMLVYIDDILCINNKAMETMLKVSEDFKFKKDMIEPPDIYLGGKV